MEETDFTSKLLGFVGNECIVLESLLLINDPLYGALHSKNNVPIPVPDSARNLQAFREIVAMKKVRSVRSKRTDFNILSSKFKKVTSCTSNNEGVGKIKIILKKKTNDISAVRVSCDNILDTINNVKDVVVKSSSNEVPKKNIKKRKTMGEGSRNSSKKCKNQEKEEVREEQPDLPLAFKEEIEQLEGIDVKLVIQKKLTMTDLKRNNGRLSVPIGKKIEESSLLTEAEELSLDYVPQKKGSKKLDGMSVSMLDNNLKLWDKMCFKKWKMGKSEVYNITGEWYDLAVENHLKQDQKIQLWSFKRNNHLNFALVKL